jgi:hypothetical protein
MSAGWETGQSHPRGPEPGCVGLGWELIPVLGLSIHMGQVRGHG